MSGRPAALADMLAVGVAALLFVAAIVVAALVAARGGSVESALPPLHAAWMPKIGLGTPIAVIFAGIVCWYGPSLARRLPWGWALALTYAGSIGWIASLIAIDGWWWGLVRPLTKKSEYLTEVDRINDAGIAETLRTFTDHILLTQPDNWTIHVAGHPPGATLLFVVADRIGLGGPVLGAFLCISVGALASVGVALTVRMLGAPAQARAILPFLVLFPGALWIGVSADGLFAGVAAMGIAAFAYGCRRGDGVGALCCLGGGLVLGGCLYLSYGLVLLAPIVLVVGLLAATERFSWTTVRSFGAGLLGVAAVVAAFTAAGFWWWDGYRTLVERYYQGAASERPYAYWVWANLALLALVIGPAAVASLRRVGGAWWAALRRRTPLAALTRPVVAVTSAAALVVAVADLSGMSKAEVERIWLPFGVWLIVGTAALPHRQHSAWLATQAGTILVLCHLVYSYS